MGFAVRTERHESTQLRSRGLTPGNFVIPLATRSPPHEREERARRARKEGEVEKVDKSRPPTMVE